MADVLEKIDDDTCSVESFEDVGTKTASAHSEKASESIEEHVPDVLYVVEYRNVGGRIIDTRKSDKPLNISQEGGKEKSSMDQKPVIEILTQVTATMAPRRPQYGWRPGGYPAPNHPDGPIYVQPGPGGPPNVSDTRDFKVDKVETTDMIIHSEHLKSALNAIIGYYPGVDFIGERVTVEAPYHVLIHFRKELEMYKFNQPACHDEEYAATTCQHIDVLLSFLKSTFGEKIEAEENRWNMDVPLATFDLLWLLLKPGEVIYTKEDNHWFPSVVSGLGPIHRGANGAKAAYLVHHWNIEYLNGRMQRRLASTTINPFSGEQTIQSLPVIPARFIPGGAKPAAERQIRLGREYWELSKTASHKEYEGPVIDKDGISLGKVQGRVIVDCEGYARSRDGSGPHRPARPHRGPRQGPQPPQIVNVADQLPQIAPRCTCQPCQKLGAATTPSLYAGFDNLDPNKDSPPDNDLYFYVLADTISAFILGDRRWGFVEVENLRDVKFDREAFKYLVLDDEIKLTVKALIGKFANADGKVSPWPSDFVKNKGEGRIFLLHGSPGVGKTCTAECVAELTRRPLLSLTSGDISTSGSASSVERNLDYFLKLGERYGALVLLDEADVYLEERRTRDLHRNGLVSVFLRALEYYRGVLFLTTNRVEAFDTAFTSRIHVALHYKRLTDDDRQRIWTHNFERLERDSNGKAFVPLSARTFCYESEEVKTLRWNGREIRNALQTAVALAESEALEDGVETVTVAEKHLRAVVKMSRGFRDYLHKRRGWDEQDDDEEDSDVDDNVSSSSGESL